MIGNKIRDFRKRARKTLQEIADAVGTTTTTIQRMEKGDVDLVHPKLESVAAALGVGWLDLLGVSMTTSLAGLAESAAPFQAKPDSIIDPSKMSMYDVPFEVRDDSLSKLGFEAGDIVVCDVSAKAVRDVATGDIVVAQVYGPGIAQAVTVIRQFVGPAMLITNRRRGRQDFLDLDEVDAAIKGVARKRFGAIAR